MQVRQAWPSFRCLSHFWVTRVEAHMLKREKQVGELVGNALTEETLTTFRRRRHDLMDDQNLEAAASIQH